MAGKEVSRTPETKTVTVQGYTRKAPAMRGYDKVTVTETATRTTTYEKKRK